MAALRLIHWNAEEAALRAERLRAAGHAVLGAGPVDAKLLATLVERCPDVVVIDLSRQPMQGRDVALWLRSRKATRNLPLVFVDGEDAKVAKVKQQLPEAHFASWRGVRGAIRRALAAPPTAVAKPASVLAGYSGTPLPKKLGIKAGMVVGLLGAPDDVETTLGELPAAVTLRRGARGNCDLILWFTTSASDLKRRVKALGQRSGAGGLWILWPKQASGMTTDLTQSDVRAQGLGNGLVDYKIAAFDATWSGLKFARRKG